MLLGLKGKEIKGKTPCFSYLLFLIIRIHFEMLLMLLEDGDYENRINKPNLRVI